MAFAVTGRRREQTDNINEEPGEIVDYVCDTEADVQNLPVYPEIRMGSTAFVLATGSVKMLGSDNWRAL
jgi:hypothetical protein